jgi:hypothetical protein
MWAQLSKNDAAIRCACRFLLGLLAKNALEQAHVLEHAEDRSDEEVRLCLFF